MNPGDVACVILASGLSERFGETDKLKSLLSGRPILDYVLETALSVGFANIFIVTRGSDFPGITVIKNQHPDKGQGHALRLGLNAVQAEGWNHACVLLGDMPLVEASYINSLIESLSQTQSVISSLDGQRMPPAVFGKNAMDEILAGTSNLGARSVFEALDLQTFPIGQTQVLDVDTLEDLNNIEAAMRARTK